MSFIPTWRSAHLFLKWTDGTKRPFSIALRAHFFTSVAVLGPGIFVVLSYNANASISSRIHTPRTSRRAGRRSGLVNPWDFCHQVFGAIATENSLARDGLKDGLLKFLRENSGAAIRAAAAKIHAQGRGRHIPRNRRRSHPGFSRTTWAVLLRRTSWLKLF